MAKSGEIADRFNEVENIHQEIKGNMMKYQKKKIATEQ